MNKLLNRTTTDLDELTFSALNDFCDGYGWMFDKKFQCSQKSAATVAAGDVNKAMEGIGATSTIAYTFGDDDKGEFLVLLNRDALFSLGGTTVMFPVPRIKEDRTKGSEEDAKNLTDAIGEVGNLLKGSFSKQFHTGTADVDGFEEQLEMQLCLPGAVVGKDLTVDEAVSEYHLFTYQFACSDLDPFLISVAYPVK